jgi:hypothetical protein
MNTTHSRQAKCTRGTDKGAILIVVLIVMIALLGLGMTGLFLTSGTIQMNTNINLRNQALIVAEAGIERAREVLNTPLPTPPIPALLAGSTTSSDEVPTKYADCGGDARGAILVDQITTACQGNPLPAGCRLLGIDFPSLNRTSDLPANVGAVARATMGKYTVYIRQDQADCRMGNYTCDLATPLAGADAGTCTPPAGAPPPNGAIVVRSEGVASDNKTRVVLEMTMIPSQGLAQALNTPLSALCASGANGCDDNSSVQNGIVVNSNVTQQPPTSSGGAPGGAGGASGTGGAGGVGGTTTMVGTGASGGSSSSTGGAGTGGSGTGGSCGGICMSPKACCNNSCVDTGTDSNNCGSCDHKCQSGQTCTNGVCTDSKICLSNAIQANGVCSENSGCARIEGSVKGSVAMTCCPELNGQVTGTVSCNVKGSDCQINSSGKIYGDLKQQSSTELSNATPDTTVPACTTSHNDVSGNDSTSLNANGGVMCIGNLGKDSGGNITLTSGTYVVTGQFKLNMSTSLTINGTVKLYVLNTPTLDGDVNVTGNNPANFVLIWNGTGILNHNGTGSFTGVILAPKAQINLDSYNVTGVVVGNGVQMNSQGRVTYTGSICL